MCSKCKGEFFPYLYICLSFTIHYYIVLKTIFRQYDYKYHFMNIIIYITIIMIIITICE